MLKIETMPSLGTKKNTIANGNGLNDDFFNMSICIASITKWLVKSVNLSKEDIEIIESQKQIIISSLAIIADTLKIDIN